MPPSSPPPPPPPPQLSAARKLIYGVVLLVGVFGLPELGLRLLLPADVWLYSWERAGGLLQSHGNRLLPRPGPAGPFMDGPYRWTATVNAQGLREDLPVSALPAAGERRLLGLGDSWMFGTSVTQGATLADQVEDRLEAAGWAARVDVINAGVPSFSAFDVLWRWHELEDDLTVDGVLLSVPHNTAKQAEAAAEREAWYRAAAAAPPLDLRLYRLLRLGLDRYRRPRYAVPPRGEAAAAAEADLMALIDDVRARGLPIYVLLSATELERALAGAPPPVAEAGRYAARGGITGWAVLPQRECWGYRDLGHPSERGVGALSAVVASLVTTGRSMEPSAVEPACSVAPRPPG